MASAPTGVFPLWGCCAKAYSKQERHWGGLARLPAVRGSRKLKRPHGISFVARVASSESCGTEALTTTPLASPAMAAMACSFWLSECFEKTSVYGAVCSLCMALHR